VRYDTIVKRFYQRRRSKTLAAITIKAETTVGLPAYIRGCVRSGASADAYVPLDQINPFLNRDVAIQKSAGRSSRFD
jgi:hypothetical protein